jgi:hypothetical protein
MYIDRNEINIDRNEIRNVYRQSQTQKVILKIDILVLHLQSADRLNQ